ncbi:MAG: hypothetical protein WD097_00800 [Balneolales bacterium]
MSANLQDLIDLCSDSVIRPAEKRWEAMCQVPVIGDVSRKGLSPVADHDADPESGSRKRNSSAFYRC